METETRPLLTVREAAELLAIGPRAVQRYARSGVLPFYRVGHLLRFDRDEILARLSRSVNEEAS